MAKYEKDFPQPVEAPASNKMTHENLEVIRTARVADRSEYDMQLATYLKKLEENENDQVKEFILHRVAFVVSELDNELPGKINKQNLARENKRKLVVYNVECDGQTSWQQVKQRRLNPFGGVGPGVSKTRLENVVHTYEDGLLIVAACWCMLLLCPARRSAPMKGTRTWKTDPCWLWHAKFVPYTWVYFQPSMNTHAVPWFVIHACVHAMVLSCM